MDLYNYTPDLNKGHSCSYFFFGTDNETTDTQQELSRRELKESISKSFTDIATYWCYVLISDDLRRLVNPAVISKDTNEAFNGPENIWLNGIGLVKAFVATSPVFQMEHAGNNFQLVEHYIAPTDEYTLILSALPGPGYNDPAPLNTISEFIGQHFSFIFI